MEWLPTFFGLKVPSRYKGYLLSFNFLTPKVTEPADLMGEMRLIFSWFPLYQLPHQLMLKLILGFSNLSSIFQHQLHSLALFYIVFIQYFLLMAHVSCFFSRNVTLYSCNINNLPLFLFFINLTQVNLLSSINFTELFPLSPWIPRQQVYNPHNHILTFLCHNINESYENYSSIKNTLLKAKFICKHIEMSNNEQ